MSVTNVSVPKPLQITQGLITKACAIFVSNVDIPAGTEIKLDPALFIQNPNSLDIGSYYYTANFPSIDNTTIPMTLVGLTIEYKNLDVSLTRINSKTFEIQIEFLCIEDLNSYLTNYSYDILDYYLNTSPPSAYLNAGRFLSMKIEYLNGGVEKAQANIPVTGFQWNQESLSHEINFLHNTCYKKDEDFKVDIIFDNIDLPIGSVYHAGIFRVTNVDNNQGFRAALKFRYAKINNVAYTVETVGPDSGLYDQIKDVCPIYLESGKFKTTFSIDADYFNTTDTDYRVFIIYKRDGKWYSAYSQIITPCPDALPPIKPDITTEIKVCGELTTGDGLKNLPKCVEVEICQTLDKASYNSQLAALGLLGDWSTYFLYTQASLKDALPGNLNYGLPPNSQVTITDTATEYKHCAKFIIPDDWEAMTYYYFVEYLFTYPDETQILSFANSIGISDVYNDLPKPIPEIICDEDHVQLPIEFTSAIPNVRGKLFLTVNDEIFDTIIPLEIYGPDNKIETIINYDELDLDIEYCLKNPNYALNPAPGTCPCDLVMVKITKSNNEYKFEISCDPSWSTQVASIEFFNNPTYDIINDNHQLTVTHRISPRYPILITITRKDGCVYRLTLNDHPYSSTTLQINPCTNNQTVMSCVDKPYITHNCIGGGTIYLDVLFNGGAGATSSVKEFWNFGTSTWDPYTAAINASYLDRLIRWTLVYPVGSNCISKTLYYYETCYKCVEP